MNRQYLGFVDINGAIIEPSGNTLFPMALYDAAGNPISSVGGALLVVGVSTTAAVSQALTTSVNVKATAGQLFGYAITNPNAGVVYVFWYNTATTPTIGSTTNLIYEIGIPAGGAANVEFGNGIACSAGLAVAVSTSATSSAAPGTGMVVTTIYV